jgi:hypothetical protein
MCVAEQRLLYIANLDCAVPMSALRPKADIRERDGDVRFVPKADIQEYATCIRLNPDYGTADCWLYNAAQGHSA